jgi:hypothetical protein
MTADHRRLKLAISRMYDLLTTTRCDPYLQRLAWNNHDGHPSSYLLLQFHYDRLYDAAVQVSYLPPWYRFFLISRQHDWPEARSSISYTTLYEACQTAVASYDGDPADAFKVRSFPLA